MLEHSISKTGHAMLDRQSLWVEDQAWELLPSFQLKHISSGPSKGDLHHGLMTGILVFSMEAVAVSVSRFPGLCASAGGPGHVVLEACILVRTSWKVQTCRGSSDTKQFKNTSVGPMRCKDLEHESVHICTHALGEN